MFVEAGLGDRTSVYEKTVTVLRKSFTDHIPDMVSNKIEWLVDLEMIEVDISPLEWKALGQLPNLRSLVVLHKHASRGEWASNADLLSAMAGRAQARSAFRHLRTIFLGNGDYLSGSSFLDLNSFPKLDSFGVYNAHVSSRVYEIASVNNWRHQG